MLFSLCKMKGGLSFANEQIRSKKIYKRACAYSQWARNSFEFLFKFSKRLLYLFHEIFSKLFILKIKALYILKDQPKNIDLTKETCNLNDGIYNLLIRSNTQS